MRRQAPFLPAKCLLLLASAWLSGCALTTSHPRVSPLDHSDAAHYNRTHAPSPDYRGEDRPVDARYLPKHVYSVKTHRLRGDLRVQKVPAEDP